MVTLIILLFISTQLMAQEIKIHSEHEDYHQRKFPSTDSLINKFHFEQFSASAKDFRIPTISVDTEIYNMPFYEWSDSIDYKIKASPVPDELIFKQSHPKIKLK